MVFRFRRSFGRFGRYGARRSFRKRYGSSKRRRVSFKSTRSRSRSFSGRRRFRFRKRVLGVRSRFSAKVHRALNVETFCVDRYVKTTLIRQASVYTAGVGAGWVVATGNSTLGLSETYSSGGGIQFFPIIPHRGWIPLDIPQTVPTTPYDAGHIRGNQITITGIEITGNLHGAFIGAAADQQTPHRVKFGLIHLAAPNTDSTLLQLTDVFDFTAITGVSATAALYCPRQPYKAQTSVSRGIGSSQIKIVKSKVWVLNRMPWQYAAAATDYPANCGGINGVVTKTFRWKFKVNKTITIGSDRPILDTGVVVWDQNWYFFAYSDSGNTTTTSFEAPVLEWMHVRFRYKDV